MVERVATLSRGREAARLVDVDVAVESMIPDRNSIDERCPSPIARRLTMKRSSPAVSPDWSGAGTMDGLESAAASMEYSWVKYAPMRSRCSRSRRPGSLDETGHGLVVALQGVVQVGVPIAELIPCRRQRGCHVSLGQGQDPLDDLPGSGAPVRGARLAQAGRAG